MKITDTEFFFELHNLLSVCAYCPTGYNLDESFWWVSNLIHCFCDILSRQAGAGVNKDIIVIRFCWNSYISYEFQVKFVWNVRISGWMYEVQPWPLIGQFAPTEALIGQGWPGRRCRHQPRGAHGDLRQKDKQEGQHKGQVEAAWVAPSPGLALTADWRVSPALSSPRWFVGKQWQGGFGFCIFGSDRSPRSQDVVYPFICDFMLKGKERD